AIAEAPLHLRQQPALFESALLRAEPQRPRQQQRFGFAHRPDRGFHRVPAQLFQRGHALVAVDHQVTLAVVLGNDHHDGRLLAAVSQRRQQSALPVRLADLANAPIAGRVGETPVASSPARDSVCSLPGLVFCGGGGSAPGSLVGSIGYGPNWSFAARRISAPVTPMKSASCTPNCLSRTPMVVGPMAPAIAAAPAAGAPASHAGQSSRRSHSPGSGCANSPASFAGGPSDTPARDRPVVGLLLANPVGTTGGRFCMVSSGPLAS